MIRLRCTACFFSLGILVFPIFVCADNSSTGANPSSSADSTSPNVSVTIGQSSQQLDAIKSFFDHSTYDDLLTPTSGINSFVIPENS